MPLNTAAQNPGTFNVIPAGQAAIGMDRGSCSWFERPMSGNRLGDRLQIVDKSYAIFTWSGTEWTNGSVSFTEDLTGGIKKLVAGGLEVVSSHLDLPNMAGSPITRLFVYGDSISNVTPYGTGLNAGEPYAARLQTEYSGLTFVNPSFAGGCINAYWQNNLVSAALTSADIIVGLTGFNTLRTYGPTPGRLEDYRMAMEAYLSWCAIPEANKVRLVDRSSGTLNPAVTTSGTWVTFSAFAGSNQAQYSSTSGAVKTMTVTGDTVYIWYMRQSGATGTFTVTIDGVAQTVLSSAMSYTPSSTGNADWEPAVAAFTGLSNAAHTVTLTSGNTAAIPLIGVAGYTKATLQGPVVISGNCLRMPTAGYASAPTANDPASVSGTFSATWNPPWLYGDGGVVSFNIQHKRAVDACASNGLAVVALDASGMINPLIDITADNIHPNVYGHRKLFGAFKKRIDYYIGLHAN